MTLKCHVCGRTLQVPEDGQKIAYDLGWRLWIVRREGRHLCNVHAEQRIKRRLEARLKRMYE